MTPSPHAVIIAGGGGTRLGGVHKSALRIGGVPVLERVLAGLTGVKRPILIATGPAEQRPAIPEGCAAVPDIPDSVGGPLAGLVAAAKALGDKGITSGLLVSVAADTPFLPEDFVARISLALGPAPAAYAAWGEDFYPPNAIWRLEALQDLLPGSGKAGKPGSLKALHASLGSVRVEWSDWADANPFANLNALKDLIALQKRALC